MGVGGGGVRVMGAGPLLGEAIENTPDQESLSHSSRERGGGEKETNGLAAAT